MWYIYNTKGETVDEAVAYTLIGKENMAGNATLGIGYWIHKSALCAHILHEFVVLLEAKPSAKPQTSAIYNTKGETVDEAVAYTLIGKENMAGNNR